MNTVTKIVNHILDEHFEYVRRDVVDEEDDLTEREKSEEASNYFEYVFDKEEHPY